MAPIEVVDVPEQNDQDAPITKTIGIIYPPPEVRNIVDKTASFVARNGPEFETRIRQNELNNPKFNFLNPTDPYHAYYQHKVKEFKEGKGQEPVAPKGLSMLLQQQQLQQQQQQQLKQQEQTKTFTEQIVLKDPPPEYEFVADPPSISAFDLDVVKLTAQFVARNGRQFLTNLMHREQRNYQFDFLRPQHSLFNYFTKLVEQYTKILIPPKDLLPKLRKEAENAKGILEKARYRVEWAKYQERERQKEEEEKERERVAYASIDWHDFVVVETVDFQPNETGNLPPPTTPEEVGARVIAQERYEETPEEREAIEMDVASSDEEEDADAEDASIAEEKRPPAVGDIIQVQDMEEDSDEEIDGRMPAPSHPPEPTAPPPPPLPPKESPQPPPLPPAPDQVIIKSDYNPKVARTHEEKDNFLVSPITGEKIPADKLQEHMRIGLLDPTWMADHQRTMHTEKKDQAEVYAPGSAIGSSLKMLAERRTDIFGPGVEETQIGKKIGEEEKKEKSKVIWDGHTASMEKVTQKARENISIEEQIAVIHKAKGLLQDEEKEKIGPAMPKGGGVPQQPLLQQPTSVPKPPPQPPKAAPPPPSRPPMPSQPGPGPHRPGVMVMTPMGPQGMRPPVGMPQRPPMPPMMGGGPPMGMGGGYMPGPPMGGPPMMPPRPPMPPQPPQMPTRRPEPPQEDDQPPSKKAKTEESLIPEEVFLANNQSPVMFKVSVPKIPDKSEWKLTGQTVNLSLPLTDNVSVIKAKLHEAVGMPAGKQKLQVDGLFIKDSNTLAYYNIGPGTTIQLQLKERGGRKK